MTFVPQDTRHTLSFGRAEGRSVSWWALCAVVVLTGLAVAARWVDLTGPVPIVQALFPAFGVSAVLWLAVAAAARWWRLGTLALVIALPPLVLGGSALRADTVAAGPHDEIVMTVNLEAGHADARQVVAAGRREHVDTLILQECTPAELRALRAAGLDALLPHAAGSPAPGIRGTVVQSVHPLELLAEGPNGQFPSSPDIRVTTAYGGYRLRAVHTPAPLPDIVGDWRSALRSLARWRAAQSDARHLVMAGDFNASSAMPAFRQVAVGMTDSSRATGSGWRRTWPHGTVVPPFVQLDHVLSRGFGVVDDGTVLISGTDHLGYWARLRVLTTGAAR